MNKLNQMNKDNQNANNQRSKTAYEEEKKCCYEVGILSLRILFAVFLSETFLIMTTNDKCPLKNPIHQLP